MLTNPQFVSLSGKTYTKVEIRGCYNCKQKTKNRLFNAWIQRFQNIKTFISNRVFSQQAW